MSHVKARGAKLEQQTLGVADADIDYVLRTWPTDVPVPSRSAIRTALWHIKDWSIAQLDAELARLRALV